MNIRHPGQLKQLKSWKHNTIKFKSKAKNKLSLTNVEVLDLDHEYSNFKYRYLFLQKRSGYKHDTFILIFTIMMFKCNYVDKYRGNSLPWLLQYRLWSFQGRDTKLESLLDRNQYTHRKSLNFENWSSGELSKSGHHFRK